MSNTQILQWLLLGLSVLAGIGTILALFKLRYAERFLPLWEELKNIEAVLPVRREELRQVGETITALRQEWAKLEGEVGHLRQLREWQQANPDAPARIQQMMVDLERSKAELAALQQKLAQDEARLNQVTQEVALFTEEKNQLTEQIKALREQIAGSNKQKGDLEQTLRDLDDQRRQLEIRLAALKNDIQSHESRLNTLRPQVEKAEQEKAAAVRERDQARADRDTAKAELDGLNKSLQTYRALIENLNTQLQRTGVGHTDLTKALEDLAQPALKFEFTGRAQIDEGTALRRLSEHLKKKALYYPERIQLAFHTSLKAAHINPLVVLAGVSGTGKSALPMAYAEALGMNFISLAVQPGWSGPQDLLGFYNYLERKYKATELARSLAQMSRFSAEDLPKLDIKSRKEQMLLLLLDEMNLARIEYYFSDFLSRLEQRRGRKIEDAQRRREISLWVDAGSLPEGELPRTIFPDFNVLFVGTMNEDESTQTLSDKVIDRANVLRFGAPKELQAAHAFTVSPSSEFLPRAKWEEWVTPFDGNGFDEEKLVLAKLNQTLETINHPFGHRVFRAILDYLTNYPGAKQEASVGPRRRNALSDQIEQKIVPKLRGLDTQDDTASRCLDQIAQLIATLQDTELAEAFNRARQQNLFEWFGVKRS